MATATDPKLNQTNTNQRTSSGFEACDRIETAPPFVKQLDPDLRVTFGYIAVAVVSLIVTGVLAVSNRPSAIEEFGRVGEPFYPEFSDPTQATSLGVYAFDADEVKPLKFTVEKLENGRWAIPSHHNYPADAEDQLAKTAASVIGVKRGALVTRWKADHARYGVVDPRQDALNVDEVDGVGKRITLRGELQGVLADYIIGNRVEEGGGAFYVRNPEEDEVYIATLDLDLSTKFRDWIDTDLLGLDNWSLRAITANNYTFNELEGKVTATETSRLRRVSSTDDWQLEGLNESEEEVSKEAVRETANAIADLEIIGVRPRQKGLTADLQLDREALTTQKDVARLQSDLLTRGFLLQPGANGDQRNLKLLAREGELTAAADDGLEYHLYFGRAFTGGEEELETGLASSSVDSSSKDSTTPESEERNDEGEKAGESDGSPTEDKSATKPGRYVFVRVSFDEKHLGDLPAKPTAPEPPVDETANRDSAADDGSAETKNLVDAQAGAENSSKEASSDQAKADTQTSDAGKTDAGEGADVNKAYEDAKADYERDLKQYEQAVEDRKSRVEDGKKKAEDLNRRFADWYYVISGDSFDKLRFSRKDLVQAKKKPVDKEANKAAATEFLEVNKSKDGVVTTDSGLQYQVINAGEGESPKEDDRVRVRYRGTLANGDVFDESEEDGTEFAVDGVIPGWTEALQLMKPGAKWKLFIPPELAYGEAGSGEKIAPNSLLIFEVELLSVVD